MPHPFPFQLFLPYKTVVIAMPKPFVVKGIFFVEKLKVRSKGFMQPVLIKYLVKGFFRIRFKIPQRMVEVEEKMLVSHSLQFRVQFTLFLLQAT